MVDVYVKLDDAERILGEKFSMPVQVTVMQALRALPVSDGWEDIATYEGPENEYRTVWCQCEDSGVRWATTAYRTVNGQWFNDLEGYVPAKGYRPLPAPPSD